MAKHDVRISSLWDQLEFVCGEPTENGMCGAVLNPEIALRQVLYKCPVCGCTTAYYDIEKFIDKVTEIIVDDAEDGCSTNLTNYKHKMVSRYDSKQHIFTVLSHTNNKMKVSIKNG